MTLPNEKPEVAPKNNPETGEQWTVETWGICTLDEDGNLAPEPVPENAEEKSK